MRFIKNKHVRNIAIILLISVLIEIFICNFNHFKTLNYQVKTYDNPTIVTEKNEDGEDEKKYVEIGDINQEVKDIVLNIELPEEKSYIDYDIYATDEANRLYFKLPTRHFYKNIDKSKYIQLNLSGKSEKIKIEFSDTDIKVSSIEINKPVPLYYSVIRQFLIAFVIIFIYVFRPNSELYKYKFDLKKFSQKLIIALFFILEIFIMNYAVNANVVMKDLHQYPNQFQYHFLTEALAKGHVYLDREPSEGLKNMENPYDYFYRKELSEEGVLDYPWDMAYYNGKYYVYFGVVPAITTYLPAYLIFHKHIPNYLVVLIMSIIIMFGIFLLLKEIVKRYFKNTKFLVFLLILGWLVNTIGLLSILSYPTTYNIPILYSLGFTIYGLYFWISSVKEDKLSKGRLFLGSLCMALVAGCRPQLLVGSLFAIPIFWKSVFKDRKLFSRKGIPETIAFVLPYIIVAIPIMLYNYVRFGSVTNFGANYNLTGNDMTKRGFVPGRIGLGLFSLLFQLPNFGAVFPFLYASPFMTNYMGTTVEETLFGGVFTTNILLVLSLCIKKFKEKIPKKLYKIGIVSLIIALIIAVLDVEMAGILPRYIVDFEWLLCIPTIFIVFSILNSQKLDKRKKTFLGVCLILIIFSLIYQFLYMFDDKLLHDMIHTSTDFYFKWYYLIQFWL